MLGRELREILYGRSKILIRGGQKCLLGDKTSRRRRRAKTFCGGGRDAKFLREGRNFLPDGANFVWGATPYTKFLK